MKEITIYEHGQGGPVIFWLMFPFAEGETEHLLQCIDELVPDAEYALVVCQVDDWNRELSPWKAGEFGGEGEKTLAWLLSQATEKLGSDRKKILAGYSLAGLFTLWAAYKTDAFDGYVCCSGSLWFEGWKEFACKNNVKSQCDIYLSLGGKEEKTDNKIMATIGEATRSQEKLLKADPNVRRAVLEMNSGGHFADSGKRLAKGIRWILN